MNRYIGHDIQLSGIEGHRLQAILSDFFSSPVNSILQPLL